MTWRIVDQRNKNQTIAVFVRAPDARMFADIMNVGYKRPRYLITRKLNDEQRNYNAEPQPGDLYRRTTDDRREAI